MWNTREMKIVSYVFWWKTSVADPNPGSGAFRPLDPESGMGKKSGMNEIIFARAYKQFFGLKYLNSLMWIRDGKNSEPGSGTEKIRNRDPG